MTPPDLLTNVLSADVNWILKAALFLAAVATVVMAILEAVKAIARLRYVYHSVLVKRWLGPRAYKELLSLTLGKAKNPGPLLDQPTDKLMAQLQAAANLALDFPNQFPALYEVLTTLADNERTDAATWKKFSAAVESGELNPSDPAKAVEVTAATRARTRLDHIVARKLDAFQTKTEFWWARLNQLVAIAGATVVLLRLNQNLLIAIVGGMVAPVAKDLATALSGLRGK